MDLGDEVFCLSFTFWHLRDSMKRNTTPLHRRKPDTMHYSWHYERESMGIISLKALGKCRNKHVHFDYDTPTSLYYGFASWEIHLMVSN